MAVYAPSPSFGMRWSRPATRWVTTDVAPACSRASFVVAVSTTASSSPVAQQMKKRREVGNLETGGTPRCKKTSSAPNVAMNRSRFAVLSCGRASATRYASSSCENPTIASMPPCSSIKVHSRTASSCSFRSTKPKSVAGALRCPMTLCFTSRRGYQQNASRSPD